MTFEQKNESTSASHLKDASCLFFLQPHSKRTEQTFRAMEKSFLSERDTNSHLMAAEMARLNNEPSRLTVRQSF